MESKPDSESPSKIKKKQLPVLKVISNQGPEIKMFIIQVCNILARSDSAVYLDKLKITKDGLQLKKNMKFSELKEIQDGFLGKGAFGSVQKYIHLPTSQIIAMKQVVYSGSLEQFKSLKIELDTLIKCDCEYLIQCYGVFFEQGKLMFALEYMDFDSLAFIIKQLNQIPEVILGIIVCQVLKGLSFLHHTMKLIHRDIKPSNLLINSEGQVKIADFGISAQLEETLQKKSTWVGTTRYMSPERLKGEEYTSDSDL